jgi:hypothetical protein
MPSIKLSKNEPVLPEEYELSVHLLHRLDAVVAAHPSLTMDAAVSLALEQFVTVAERLSMSSRA